MLTRKNDAPLEFDFDRVQEQTKDNPVFYVQYAHARIRSVLRRAAASGLDVSDGALAGAPMDGLGHPAEVALMRRMAEWPRLVEAAARAHEPHRVVGYLQDLAGDLHALWTLGHDKPELRLFLPDDPATSRAKLALARAVGVVISTGLAIVGVEPVEEMR